MNADRKLYLLLFFTVAVFAAEAYLYMGMRSLGAEAARIRGSIIQDISALRERNTEMNANDRERLDRILEELDASRRESALANMVAKFQTQVRVEQLAANLTHSQRRRQETFGRELESLRTDSVETSRQVEGLQADAGAVKNDLDNTRVDVDRTAGEVSQARAEAAGLEGTIAMNRKELEALRAISKDREYTEFSLSKAQKPQEIAGLQVALKKVDPGRNLFTLAITSGDKTISEKDRNINEPMRLVLEAGGTYEIVVNAIAKNRVSGYIVSANARMTASTN